MDYVRNSLNIVDRAQDIRSVRACDQDGFFGQDILEIRSFELRILFRLGNPPLDE